MSRRGWSVLLGVGAAMAVLTMAAPVQASVTFGRLGDPTNTFFCNGSLSLVPTATAEGPIFAAPASGVITSWQHHALGAPGTLRLRLFRAVSPPGTFLLVGQSKLETETPGSVNTFATRVPVAAGDLLGLGTGTQINHCVTPSGPGNEVSTGGPQFLEQTSVPVPGPVPALLNIAATIEPDSDGDSYGDESQDDCDGNGARLDDCVPPNTAIDGPTKTKKTKVTFTLTANEGDASFECALDKGGFNPCSSPHRAKKLRPGKHTLRARATDSAKNLGPEASFPFRVTKPKKK